MLPDERFAYLLASLVLLPIWLFLFWNRKDLRKEITVMSFIIGILSVATSYFWWTHDWWQPQTIFSTRVGIEDFIMGFFAGGIMATLYEEIFKKRLYKKRSTKKTLGAFAILLLLAQITSFLFWGLKITSFWSSLVAMVIVASVMFFHRRDLLTDGVLSGIFMVIASLPFYYFLIIFYPEWVGNTYFFENLTNIMVTGIPIEELIFWFLAGLIFGPFYEYWNGERLRKTA